MVESKQKASPLSQTQVYLSGEVRVLDYDFLIVATLDSAKLPAGSPKDLNKTSFSLTGSVQDRIDLHKLETEQIPALAKKIGIDDFSFPSGLFPSLGKYLDLDLAFNYRTPTETQEKSYLVVFSIGTSDGSPPPPPSEDDLQFFFFKNENTGQTTVGVEYNAPIHLPKAPSILKGVFDDFSISDLRGVYAGKSSSPSGEKIEIPAITLIDPTTGKTRPVSKEITLNIDQGFSLGFTLHTPGSDQALSFNFPSSSKKDPKTSALLAAAPAAGGGSMSKWFDINKSFGPLDLQRLGIVFDSGTVGLGFDASLKLAAFTLGLDGLTLGFDLQEIKEKEFLKSLRISLDGLSLAYESGPIGISGGFLKTTEKVGGETIEEYVGEASIRLKTLSISAIGSYAQLNGQPSLFIFALLDYPIGGPSYFFVTGLAAGFGYNQNLILPNQDQVQNFPLVAAALDPGKVFPNGAKDSSSLSQAVEVLNQYIPPKIGEQWLAAGIRFTSFEMIQSFALLTVAFGTRLEIALIGLSKLQIPTPPAASGGADETTVIAKVEMSLLVKFDPDEGLIAATAVLTPNSWILSEDCKLQGGFAFYVWYSGEHAGDFVVTLGGYNPNYTPEQWYPQEPRLGFNWKIDSKITAKGGVYFALTPHAIMAGGSLAIVFKDGGLRAWFTAHADFLIEWQPFHYEISIGISIGASYTFDVLGIKKTISVSLGAGLDLWGPSFGGKVHLHFYIVSVTIHIGNQNNSGPPALNFKETSKALLPKTNPDSGSGNVHSSQALFATGPQPSSQGSPVYTTAKIIQGVIQTPGAQSSPNESSDGQPHSIVNAHLLQIGVGAAVPATELQYTVAGKPSQQKTIFTYSGDLYIKPMQSTVPMTSILSVKVELVTDNEIVTSQFTIEPILGNAPKAMWAKYDGRVTVPAAGESLLIPNVPLGLKLAPKSKTDHTIDPSAPLPIANLLADEPNFIDTLWPQYQLPPALSEASPLQRIEESLKDPTVSQTRLDILSRLDDSGILSVPTDPYYSPELLTDANAVFTAVPILANLGQQPN